MTPSTNKCCRFCKDPVYNTLTHTVMFYKCKSLSCHCHKPTEPSEVCGVLAYVDGEGDFARYKPCQSPKPCPLHDKPQEAPHDGSQGFVEFKQGTIYGCDLILKVPQNLIGEKTLNENTMERYIRTEIAKARVELADAVREMLRKSENEMRKFNLNERADGMRYGQHVVNDRLAALKAKTDE